MNKLEKIELEAQKARDRIAETQALLKNIESQRTEQENLQIVQQIRALKLSRGDLYAFLANGALPSKLDETPGNTAAPEQETIYSRRNKPRNQGYAVQDNAPGIAPENTEGNGVDAWEKPDASDNESEEKQDEE
jgi:hypothetical protein